MPAKMQWTPHQLRQIEKWREEGAYIKVIADRLDCSETSVRDAIKNYGLRVKRTENVSNKRVFIGIYPGNAEILRQLAAERGTSVTKIGEEAIQFYLDHLRNKEEQKMKMDKRAFFDARS